MASVNEQVTQVVERSAAQYSSLLVRLLALLLRAWSTSDPYRGQSVSAAAARSVVLVTQAQQRVRLLAAAEQRAVLRILGQDERLVPSKRGTTYPRGGVNIYDVWNRPAEQFRYAASKSRGGSVEAIRQIESEDVEDEAARAMRNRIVQLADTELALAKRDENRRVLDAFTGVKYYRRVIHPERSRTGTCGLCVVAATRVYKKDVLLPLHDGCKCTVLPILGERGGEGDPGWFMNRADLDKIYELAGGTWGDRLRTLRWKEVPHGEIGNVLVYGGVDDNGSRVFEPYFDVEDSQSMWETVTEIADQRIDMGGSSAEKQAHEAMKQTAASLLMV